MRQLVKWDGSGWVEATYSYVSEDEGAFDKAVLLHLDTKKYYSLNQTGLRIWQMLGEGKTPADIVDQLQAEFDVTPERARESVISLMNELITEKLLKPA